jgi:hypothetical protein
MSPLPKNLSLKNYTALELHKFIGEKMKQSSMQNKSVIPRTLVSIEAEREEGK